MEGPLKLEGFRFEKKPDYRETMKILEPYLARTRIDFEKFLAERKNCCKFSLKDRDS